MFSIKSMKLYQVNCVQSPGKCYIWHHRKQFLWTPLEEVRNLIISCSDLFLLYLYDDQLMSDMQTTGRSPYLIWSWIVLRLEKAACISSAFSFCYILTKSLWIKFLLSRYFIADDTWRTISVIWEDCRRVWFFRKKCKRHPRKYKPEYNSNKHRIITAISNVWAP